MRWVLAGLAVAVVATAAAVSVRVGPAVGGGGQAQAQRQKPFRTLREAMPDCIALAKRYATPATMRRKP